MRDSASIFSTRPSEDDPIQKLSKITFVFTILSVDRRVLGGILDVLI